MPIYEYQCDSCADRFEVKQSMKDDPLTTCPRCGKRVQRLISSPAIMFKGSGWYVTDYSDKMKPSSGNEAPAPRTEEKKEAAPSTSEQTTSTAPSTPASPPRPHRQAPRRARPQQLKHSDRLPRRLPPPNSSGSDTELGPRSLSRARLRSWPAFCLDRASSDRSLCCGAFCCTFADGLTALAFGVAAFADFANRSCAAARLFCKLFNHGRLFAIRS